MVGRSLKASQQGIQLAKQALIRKRLKQKDLIGFVCHSRQPISKFFTGKPVDREIFVGICEQLELTWEEIAELSEAGLIGREESNSFPSAVRKGELGGLGIDIDTLVQQVRQQRHDKI